VRRSKRTCNRRNTFGAGVLAVVLVALVALAGCGGDDSGGGKSSGRDGTSSGSGGSSTKVYGAGDSISVANGQTFVIALESNPTTGYAWTAAANPNATFVKSEMATSSTLVGAAGTQQLTFKATATGSSTLTLNYARSFEPGTPPAQTQTFPLTVK